MTSARARWLAELARAIEEAQRLAWRIGFADEPHPEAMEIYQRLEIARIEVESLRRNGWAVGREDFPSEWMEFLPERLRPRDAEA